MNLTKINPVAILITILMMFTNVIEAQQTEKAKPPYNKLRIGVSLLSRAHPFFFDLEKGLQDAGLVREYELIIVGAEYDIDRQKNQLERFIIEDVDAIVVNPCHQEKIGSAIIKANRARIPVFTVDTGCTVKEAEVVCHIATNNLKAGELAAEAIIEGLNGKGKVIMLIQSDITSTEQRVQGFMQRISKESKISIIAKIHTDATREAATNHMKDALNAYPGLKGIFAKNDEVALGAFYALQEVNREDLVLVGFDASYDAREYIKRQTVFYDSIMQDPELMGQRTIEAIEDYFSGRALNCKEFDPERYRLSLSKNKAANISK